MGHLLHLKTMSAVPLKDARGMEQCNNSAYSCPEIDCKHNKMKRKNEPLLKPGWKHFICQIIFYLE